MGFFSKKDNTTEPEWMAQMTENQERWLIFIEKMQAKLQELCEAAVPELQNAFKEDKDVHKRAVGSMLSGIKGQLQQMRKKVTEVYEDKIYNFYSCQMDEVELTSPHRNTLREFRDMCSDKKDAFEKNIQHNISLLDSACTPDWEDEYKKVLDEFELIKNKFLCKQCGAVIPLSKIYFITTYVTCSHCNTQNTFVPGTQTSMLESIGRSLAEQRTAPLLKAYEIEKQKERDLYHKIHENRISFTDDEKRKKIKESQNDIWKKEREDAIADAPGMYEKYLRAMFTEWNKIVPDLTEQNEKFYERMLHDFKKYNN